MTRNKFPAKKAELLNCFPESSWKFIMVKSRGQYLKNVIISHKIQSLQKILYF